MPKDQALCSSPSANRAELWDHAAAPHHLWAVTLEFLCIPPSSSPILQGTALASEKAREFRQQMASLKFP